MGNLFKNIRRSSPKVGEKIATKLMKTPRKAEDVAAKIGSAVVFKNPKNFYQQHHMLEGFILPANNYIVGTLYSFCHYLKFFNQVISICSTRNSYGYCREIRKENKRHFFVRRKETIAYFRDENKKTDEKK